ncbi:MAG: cbb3-type cytochrome c oxidase subunit 3 [Magnetovibrio sp.]|nr:cbb3-type cytochrome c oxidase subunit 3 [Magnetovibrio sp.]
MDFETISEMARSAWVVWLALVFGSITFWAYRPKNKDRFEADAMIIFDKDNGENGGQSHG